MTPVIMDEPIWLGITFTGWLQLLTVIVLGGAAFFQEDFRRLRFAPRLALVYEHNPPFFIKTPLWYFNRSGDPVRETQAYFIRLKALNEGKSQARLCEVAVAEYWSHENRQWSRVERFQQAHLKWATRSAEKGQFSDINPSALGAYVDIGHVAKEDENGAPVRRLTLAYAYPIGGYQVMEVKVGERVRLKLIIASENAKDKTYECELRWTGNWQDDESAMLREFDIRLSEV